jgi:hypothetical protein
MPTKKKSILLNLSPKRYEKVSKLSKLKEKSITAIIEDAIDNYIQDKVNSPTKKSDAFETAFDMEKETNIW